VDSAVPFATPKGKGAPLAALGLPNGQGLVGGEGGFALLVGLRRLLSTGLVLAVLAVASFL
jgi:hypothetical protein